MNHPARAQLEKCIQLAADAIHSLPSGIQSAVRRFARNRARLNLTALVLMSKRHALIVLNSERRWSIDDRVSPMEDHNKGVKPENAANTDARMTLHHTSQQKNRPE
jgi:hypothetical protein